jgi:hypothetical protein
MQLNQQVEPRLHLFMIGESQPIMLMQLAGGKTVLEVPLAYFAQNGLRRRAFRSIGCPVQATSVAFEIFAKRKRLAHRLLGDFIVSVVD